MHRRKSNSLRIQQLESRRLLAGDIALHAADANVAAIVAETHLSESSDSMIAEGEAANDLVAFAAALKDAGVQFFGANWSPANTQQKELFEDGASHLPFFEVTGSDRSLNAFGSSEDISAFPTWEFPDGSREEGVLSLETISTRSGVVIPQSEGPSFKTVGNQSVAIGSPLHIPIDVYDPNGGAQTVTISVDDPSLVQATVLSGNRSIRIDMAGYEDMVFELFEQRAPNASGRVIELAENSFYDGVVIHRIVDNFVIQGGDPTGNGTGGSTLGDFDDDFHPDLQHNRTGVLSYAKSADDTNDSQFFVTEVPARFLDFNHSVFGQLVEGEDVREAISEHAVNNSDKPTIDIIMETIEVFTDIENSVVMLKAASGATGSTTATIKVTDADGNSHSETITIDVVADEVDGQQVNSQPFLSDISLPASYPAGQVAELQLNSIDVEGDAVTYMAASQGSNASVLVDAQTGLLQVTPASGFTGRVDVLVGVQPGPGVFGNGITDRDTQQLTFIFEEQPEILAEIQLRLVDAEGNSIDSVEVGEQFFVEYVGVDARSAFDLGGIFAAYADIDFDSTIARPVGVTYPDGISQTGRGGTLADGMIDELGSINFATSATRIEETLLAVVQMEAIAAGNISITSSPADVLGNDVLLYGLDNAIPASQVDYGSVSINVSRPVADTPSRIILPSVVARAHLIPADGQQTAMMFGAAVDSTVTIQSIGSVSLTPDVRAFDRNLNPVGQYVDGTFTLDVSEGEQYALVFAPQSTERLFMVKSSAGVNGIYGANGNNIFQPNDVNGDNAVSAVDAVIVINRLGQDPGQDVVEGEAQEYLPANRFADVNGDGKVTALDALRVLNHINNAQRENAQAKSTSDFLVRSNTLVAESDEVTDEAEIALPIDFVI